MKEKNKKLLEWGLILLLIMLILIYKYVVWGCVILCGDWYDD